MGEGSCKRHLYRCPICQKEVQAVDPQEDLRCPQCRKEINSLFKAPLMKYEGKV